MRGYRQAILLALLTCLSGCSCHRQPDAEATAVPHTAATASAYNASPADPPADATADAARRARLDAFQSASSTVVRYLTTWPGHPDEADRMWVGGQPAPVPDDANLRSLEGLTSLRVRNEQPIALDDQAPPQAIEVPVQLTAQTSAGPRRFNGWYRVRRQIGGEGWELTSASLQPQLD